MYGDIVFSADFSFTKRIDLWSGTNSIWYDHRLDTTSVRVFFIKNPDADADREWLMAEMVPLK